MCSSEDSDALDDGSGRKRRWRWSRFRMDGGSVGAGGGGERRRWTLSWWQRSRLRLRIGWVHECTAIGFDDLTASIMLWATPANVCEVSPVEFIVAYNVDFNSLCAPKVEQRRSFNAPLPEDVL